MSVEWIGTGITALSIAVVLLVIFFIGLRFWRRLESGYRRAFLDDAEITQTEAPYPDAIIVVGRGARVSAFNEQARQWFHLDEYESLTLDRIVRQIRPGERFLDLCHKQDEARLSVAGTVSHAVSYYLGNGDMLISLRPIKDAEEQGDMQTVSDVMLKSISQFSQAIISQLDFEQTVRAILQGIATLIPLDSAELKLFQDNEDVVIYRANSDLESGDILRVKVSQFGEMYRYVLEQDDLVLSRDVRALDTPWRDKCVMRSYLGGLLKAGGLTFGVLEIGQMAASAYTLADKNILSMVLGQVAASLRNAQFYRDEQTRQQETTSMMKLFEASGSIDSFSDLIEHIIHVVSTLLPMDVIGVILYDDFEHVLKAQKPFKGLSDEVVSLYQVKLTPEQQDIVMETTDILLTDNAPGDWYWQKLNLDGLALAASIYETALAPLRAGQKFIGFLHLSNHSNADTTTFSAEEQRLIRVLSTQISIVLQNILLVRTSRERALRADALRRLAMLSTSVATDAEILRYAAREMTQLLGADFSAVFLIDEHNSALILDERALYGVDGVDLDPALRKLFITDINFTKMVSGSRRPFMSNDILHDERLLDIYRPVVEKLGVRSAINVPLFVGDKSLGEWMIGSRREGMFNEYDLQVLVTAAGQLSMALDAIAHRSITDDDLRRRVDSLLKVAHSSRLLHVANAIDDVLSVLHNELKTLLRAECGNVFLLEEDDAHNLSIENLVGDAHSAAVWPLEQMAYQRGECMRIEDFSRTQFRPPHSGVQSALIVPIKLQDRVEGLIYMHAARPEHFTEEQQFMAENLAYHAAIAVDNLRRYHSLKHDAQLYKKRASLTDILSTVSDTLSPEVSLEEGLAYLGAQIQKITSFQKTLFSLYDEDTGVLQRVSGTGFTPTMMNELRSRQQSWTSLKQLLRPEFKYGRAYFIPENKRPVVPPDIHIVSTGHNYSGQGEEDWHAQDLLLIPLYKVDGSPLGLLSVDAPEHGQRPDRVTIDIISSLAAYAEQFILYNLSLHKARENAERFSHAVKRLESLRKVSSENLPTLLHKDLEQTLSLQDLVQRGRRVQAGLLLGEAVSRQIDVDSALKTLAQKLLEDLDFSHALLAVQTPDGAELMAALGQFPDNVSVEALLGQRNPLRQTLRSGELLFSPNLDEDPTWQDSSIFLTLKAKSFVSLPIMEKNKATAAVMAIGARPLDGFTEQDAQVFQRISSQVSLIIQNLRLFTETSRSLQEVQLLLDFSQRIAEQKPVEMVKTLLANAQNIMRSAHAGVVFLWDESLQELRAWAVSGYADNDSMMRITYAMDEALPGRVFSDGRTRRIQDLNFAREYDFGAEKLMLYQNATGGRLPIASLLTPIRTGDRLLGLVMLDNFNDVDAFSAQDAALLESLAQQMALALENYRLVQAAEQRATQLQGLYQATVGMASSLNQKDLIESVLPRLRQIVPYDTAILWLRDEDFMVVAAANGFDNNEERLGLRVSVEDSELLKQMLETRQSIVVADVRDDRRFPEFVENPNLSWLGVPLLIGDKVVGVLALEKNKSAFYKEEYVQLANNFAVQMAVALQNAELYEESVLKADDLAQRSQRLALLNQFSASLSGLLDADAILTLTAEQIYQAFDIEQIFLLEFSNPQKPVLRFAKPDINENLPRAVPYAELFDLLTESGSVIIREDFRSSPDTKDLDLPFVAAPVLIGLPFIVDGRLRAAALLQIKARETFGPSEIELVRTIANQTGIALQNALLYASVVRTAERLNVLNRVSADISASLDPETIYTTLHWAVLQLMPVDAFVVALKDDESDEVEGVYIMEGNQRMETVHIPAGRGLSARVIASGEPLLVTSNEEELGITLGEREQPASMIAVPLIMAGKPRGMLSVQSYQKDIYTEDDVELLMTLANQASVALNNAQLFAEINKLAAELEERVVQRTADLEQEKRRTEFLLRALTEVSASLDLDRALNRTLALLNEATGAEQGTIMMMNSVDGKLYFRAGYGYASDKVEGEEAHALGLSLGEGLAGWVLQHKESALVYDLLEDARWLQYADSGSEHRSAIAIPMYDANNTFLGVLLLYHRMPAYFTETHLSLAEAIASQVSVAINNANLYEYIQKQSEELGIAAREKEIEASRREAILESVADGVLVTNKENVVNFVNESALNILGLPENEVKNRPIDEVASIFDQSGANWLQTIREWALDPYGYQEMGAYAEQIELADGRILLVHLSPVILKNDFIGTVSIIRDITYEVEVDRLKSEFVATVSHELRTPMTSIRGYVDLLMMGAAGALDENQQHFLEIIKENTVRLNVLVNDLLDVSQIEAGQVALDIKPLRLSELTDKILHEMQQRSEQEQKPIEFSMFAEENLPLVAGDRERVRQILANLIENAFRYTQANGSVMVKIHRAEDQDFLQVDVIDTGVGIAPEDQPRVFERFYRGENHLVLASAGTGLGLSLVKQLVEMHKGHIWLKSDLGQGSTFSFTLPIYKQSE